MTDNQKPIHIHDCEDCFFLGNYVGHSGDCDLYFCNQEYFRPTVISRFSSDGPDYNSGLPFVGVLPELTEAARGAVELGLLDPNELTVACGRKTVQECTGE